MTTITFTHPAATWPIGTGLPDPGDPWPFTWGEETVEGTVVSAERAVDPAPCPNDTDGDCWLCAPPRHDPSLFAHGRVPVIRIEIELPDDAFGGRFTRISNIDATAWKDPDAPSRP